MTELVLRAQSGEAAAREQVVREHVGFVFSQVAAICKRPLDWANDDELSIGLMALDEAIDRFDASRPVGFRTFARTVIRSRLVDYFRRESRNLHIPLNQVTGEVDGEPGPLEIQQAMEVYERERATAELASDIALYTERLAGYGIGLEELERSCPKHRDSRLTLLEAARLVAADPGLFEHLRSKGQLPLAEISRRSGIHRKVLERGRRYIIAVALILADDEFVSLKSFIPLADSGGGG